MSEQLAATRREIEHHISALRAEVARLELAARALSDPKSDRGARRPARQRGSRRGRPPRRAAEAESLIQANPGISVPDLARRMGANPGYVYRVTRELQRAGKVSKRGRGWHPR
jgi:hypothetical protein